MVDQRIQRRKASIGQQRRPMQERSRQRREEILRTTGELLDKVGLDDLTTILIARELKISVGSLYHYFPNKQAILYAMGEHWLQEYSEALQSFADTEIEGLSIDAFCRQCLQCLLEVYRTQRGLLPLVQAMSSVPELHDLDEAHDEIIIKRMADLFRRLGLSQPDGELQRRSRLWLEMTHAVFVTITEQSGKQARNSFEDLVALATTLLQRV